MPKTQSNPIGNDFSAAVTQLNFQEIYETLHDHVVRSTFPAANDGNSRDIAIVDDGTNVYICVKTARGWFKTAALTAV